MAKLKRIIERDSEKENLRGVSVCAAAVVALVVVAFAIASIDFHFPATSDAADSASTETHVGP